MFRAFRPLNEVALFHRRRLSRRSVTHRSVSNRRKSVGVCIRHGLEEAHRLNHPFEQGERCCQALTRAVVQNLAAVSVWITPRKKAEAELIRFTMLLRLLFSLIDAFVEIISRAVI